MSPPRNTKASMIFLRMHSPSHTHSVAFFECNQSTMRRTVDLIVRVAAYRCSAPKCLTVTLS
ncbi:hypothetical protein Poly51_48550 [Rubripirellula tenax]|uniref:Uncharacterized protein n=1 Tax=Rubripirellula tenax TaxID=2528015 RepID=A0A5C6EMT7_9BACT|nr:hypothetical protein Poly51_48550 [Rubripirellula tenax]